MILRYALIAISMALALNAVDGECSVGDDAYKAFGVEDFSRARQLAEEGAADDFMAQFTLTRIYEEGKGGPQDQKKIDDQSLAVIGEITGTTMCRAFFDLRNVTKHTILKNNPFGN